MNELIDDLAREKLLNYEVKPPDRVWDKIEKDLSVKKRMVIPAFLKIAAVFALGVGTTVMFFTLTPLITTQKQAISEGLKRENTSVPIAPAVTATNSNKKQNALAYKNFAKGKTVKRNMINEENKTSLKNSTVTPQETIVNISLNENTLVLNTTKADSNFAPINLDEEISNSTTNEITAYNNSDFTDTNRILLNQNPQTNYTEAYLKAMSESSPEKLDRELRWALSAAAGPQYSDRHLTDNSGNSQNGNSVVIDETGALAFAGGVNLELNSGSRFNFQTGVWYSKMGQISEATTVPAANFNSEVFYGSGSDNQGDVTSASDPTILYNSTGKVALNNKRVINPEKAQADFIPIVSESNTVTEATNATLEQYFEYVEVPLVVKYKVIDRKLGVLVSSGLWTNFLFNNSAYLKEDSKITAEGSSSELRTINYSGSLGLSFEYPIANSLNFSIQPSFRYYFSSIYSTENYDVRPYTFGIMTGIAYLF